MKSYRSRPGHSQNRFANGVASATAVFAGTLSAAGLAIAGTINIDSFAHDHVPGELLVKYADSLSMQNAKQRVQDIGGKVLHTFESNGAMHVKLASPMVASDLKAIATELAQDPNVDYVEANNILRISTPAVTVEDTQGPFNTPNDPNLRNLWGLTKISAERAWMTTTGAPDVIVAVIDTGVDYNHPDIAPNYWFNPGETGVDAQGRDKRTNRVDDDANGYVDDFRGWDFANNDNNPMDDHSHGTHCAGTIGARGNNGQGVVGVNWNVGLVGLKFMTASGSGSTSAATAAVEYATRMKFPVTNNSWGGGGSSQTMIAALERNLAAGSVFVAAAGNSTNNNDVSPEYPANYNVANVISVAATGSSDQIANFSNFGRRTVHVAAPGVGIYSTVPSRRYNNMSGTSMAAPHVAGVAAMMLGLYPEMTPEEVRAKLIATSDPVPALANRSVSGGRINMLKAIQP